MNPQEDQRDQETNQHWRRSERKRCISRVEYGVVLCPQHRQLRKRSSMARVPAGPQPPLHPNTRCSALIHILISTGNVTQLLPNICFCEATRGLGVGNQGEWATLSSGTERRFHAGSLASHGTPTRLPPDISVYIHQYN